MREQGETANRKLWETTIWNWSENQIPTSSQQLIIRYHYEQLTFQLTQKTTDAHFHSCLALPIMNLSPHNSPSNSMSHIHMPKLEDHIYTRLVLLSLSKCFWITLSLHRREYTHLILLKKKKYGRGMYSERCHKAGQHRESYHIGPWQGFPSPACDARVFSWWVFQGH